MNNSSNKQINVSPPLPTNDNQNANKMFFIAIVVIMCLSMLILFTLDFFKIISLNRLLHFNSRTSQQTPVNQTGQTVTPLPIQYSVDADKVVAKVGTESIYQKDVETEYGYYPLPKNAANTKSFIEKIAQDSKILQAAASEGLITLDPSIFNTTQKNYLKRTETVKNIKEQLDNRNFGIKGSIISIWFNNLEPGKVGYEKGREIARTKITQVHDAVASGKITMLQAAAQIRNDASLADVDIAYKSNAYTEFQNSMNEEISFSSAFDSIIKKANPKTVTAVYLAKDKDLKTKQLIDAVYMFAYIEEKKATSQMGGFDEWYAQKEKLYTIIYE